MVGLLWRGFGDFRVTFRPNQGVVGLLFGYFLVTLSGTAPKSECFSLVLNVSRIGYPIRFVRLGNVFQSVVQRALFEVVFELVRVAWVPWMLGLRKVTGKGDYYG